MSELARTTYVDHLDDAARADLATIGQLRRVGLGEVLFLQAERASRLAIVESGLLKIVSARSDSGYCVFGLRGRGEIVGEVAAIDGRSRTATVSAAAPTVVRLIRLSEFRSFVDRSPAAAFAVGLVLAGRLRESDHMRVVRASSSVPRRLAYCLLELASMYGIPGEDRVTIEIALTQDDLAGMVDSSRDAVAKTLQQWRAEGLIETGRRRIVLLESLPLSRLTEFGSG